MKRFVSIFILACAFVGSAGMTAARGGPALPRGVKHARHWRFARSTAGRRSRLSHAQRRFYSHHRRNKAAEEAFERQSGFPHERSGYVVDHIIPLACGGADDQSNMQWQTIAQGKAKDTMGEEGL